ncbi:MAG: VOC family protein [Planctomycetota bacterium]|nr:VOC family protein [Planctomycetota bacterium]
MSILCIDHVQLAMPPGRELEAKAFYEGLLGIPEVPKPKPMAATGGAWFERGDLKVHLGVQAEFTPARKAHPAFRVRGLGELEAKLEAAGISTLRDDRLPGHNRFFVNDPFGNRLEFLELISQS